MNCEYCDRCGRKIESFMDYPLMVITGVERLPIPERVYKKSVSFIFSGHSNEELKDYFKLPEEIIKHFQNSDKEIVLGNKLFSISIDNSKSEHPTKYLIISRDITDRAKTVLDTITIKNAISHSLTSIENVIGKEIKPFDFLIPQEMLSNDGKVFRLEFEHRDRSPYNPAIDNDSDLEKIFFYLYGDIEREGDSMGIHEFRGISLDLAKISYKGKLWPIK